MHINDQYRAFVRQYIKHGSALDVDLMNRLYDFNAYNAFNFLQTNKKYAPDLEGYPLHIKKIAQLYFSLK